MSNRYPNNSNQDRDLDKIKKLSNTRNLNAMIAMGKSETV